MIARNGAWRQRAWWIGALMLIWIATSACSCSDALGGKATRPVTPPAAAKLTAVMTRTPLAALPKTTLPAQVPPLLVVTASVPATRLAVSSRGVPTATPIGVSPTAVPNSAVPSATKPSVVAGPGSTVGLEALFGAPVAADKPFTIVATQAELNAYLAGNTFQQQGITLRDVQVTLTAKEVSAHFRVSQAETGINAGMTVRGVPTAVNGAVYFKINDVTLDQSVGGLTRLMAKAAIDRAIAQYSSAYGVPIPTAGVDVREILLQPGQLTISGRTRA